MSTKHKTLWKHIAVDHPDGSQETWTLKDDGSLLNPPKRVRRLFKVCADNIRRPCTIQKSRFRRRKAPQHAPWQVEVCNLRVTDEKVKAEADKLVEDLENAGVEVLYDDREVRPGFMFADADLFGVPVRAVVSQKTVERGVVEVSTRDKTLKTEFASGEAAEKISALVKEMLAAYNA